MIKSIGLKNYRNLTLTAQLSEQANVIIAKNGMGKSNFLESIYVVSSNKTFRPQSSYEDLIGPDLDFAKVDIELADNQLSLVISNEKRLQKKFQLNDKVRPFSKLKGLIPSVLFAPHSVDLVAGDPAARRNDLDLHLGEIYPAYTKHLKRYEKLLKNRNALLKNIREGFSQRNEIGYWTNELIDEIDFIIEKRLEFIDGIQSQIDEAARIIYHNKFGKLECRYISKHGNDKEKYLDNIRSKFGERLEVEIAAGQTLYGPHKDDYELLVDNKSLRYYGSRGQQRIGVFIWKYAQLLNLQQNLRSQKIILLVDDLLSELDQDHKKLICEFLLEQSGIQFVITSADIRDVPKSMLSQNQINLAD